MATPASDAVVREVRVAARPETVFPFFTDPDRMVRWKGRGRATTSWWRSSYPSTARGDSPDVQLTSMRSSWMESPSRFVAPNSIC